MERAGNAADDEFFDSVLYWSEPPGGRALGRATVEWLAWWRTRARDGVVRTSVELREGGVSRSATRHAVATRRWTAAGSGAVACFDVRTEDPFLTERRLHAVRTAGAVARSPGLVVASRSAAVLHGLALRRVPQKVEVIGDERHRPGTRAGARTFAVDLSRHEIADWFGVPLTDVGRTLVDVARIDAEDGIIAADCALREGVVTRAQLDAALISAAGRPGVRRARDVLGLASGRADSPLESLVRLILHNAGLPPAQMQCEIGTYAADLAWPELRLVLEADGLGKYDPRPSPGSARHRDERSREKRREQYFRRAGFQTERVTWHDATVGRAEFVEYFSAVVRERATELGVPLRLERSLIRPIERPRRS